jgi:dihydrofolate reductase
MRKIIVTEFITLDGVIEDPGGAEKTKHGGWNFQYFCGDMGKYKNEELFDSDAMLLGRITYEEFANAWPGRTDEWGFADRMNSMPKYVISATLAKTEWNNSKLIKDNFAEEISKLKEEPGRDILVAGSGKLVQLLMRHALVDEFRLMVHPIILGSGKRLFTSGEDMLKLKLTDSKTYSTGVILLTYEMVK